MRELNSCNVYCHLIKAELLSMTDIPLALLIEKKGQVEIKYTFYGLNKGNNEISLRWCLIKESACYFMQIYKQVAVSKRQ